MTILREDISKKKISLVLGNEQNLFIDTLKAKINASQSEFTITKSDLIDFAIFLLKQRLVLRNADFSEATDLSSARDLLVSLCTPCPSDGEDAKDVEEEVAKAPEWVFDKEHIEDQIAQWGLTGVTVDIVEVEDQRGERKKVLRTNPTSDDPMLDLVFEPFEGKEYNILYLGVKTEKTALWELYYSTPEHNGFRPGNVNFKISFVIEGSPDFQDLAIKIINPDWIEAEITAVRLDPGDFRADRCVGKVGEKIPAEITYISFRGKPRAFAGLQKG
jgi:hypothetical protein